MSEEKNKELIEEQPVEMSDQDKKDILAMDEVTSYFLIDECGMFIFSMGHDMNHGKIPEESHTAIKTDIINVQQLQKFAVFGLSRFGVDPESVKDRELGDYWKWFHHWDDWKKSLDEETWKKVAAGDYKEFLPKTNFKGEKL